MAVRYHEGVGRRKTSSARVRVMTGTGGFTVNDKPAADYFTRLGDMHAIMAPVRAAGLENKLDITVKVIGGGVTGQAGAVVQGLARALVVLDENLRPAMRAQGLLTRDSRMKERKKPGLKRARKAPTYTKR
uniref:Small ribosomal subunit protein uS9 n=1 Tax=uncultured Chloroflexi bacterium Rifle_16ft_4_minimus_38099 TaxID=1665073 RepID=A0A0H4TAS3_9CHLR|nr:30S ribosomal protein S9, small subunit ribosomal protein S9 [uncultured Chloroflexi bacterium Rifle_16ft_4_minimus_38099]